MQVFKITKINQNSSAIILGFTSIVILIISVTAGSLINGNIFIKAIISVGTGIFLVIRFYTYLLISKKETLRIDDKSLMVGSHIYNWSDVNWIRYDDSAIVKGLTMGTSHGKIRIHVSNKEAKKNYWRDVLSVIVSHLKKQNTAPRNYFDSPHWRFIAKMLIVINFLLPVVLFLFDITALKVFSILAIWFATSFPVIVQVYMAKGKDPFKPIPIP